MTARVNPENERAAVLDDDVGDPSLGHGRAFGHRGRRVVRAAAIGLIGLALRCADPFPSDRPPFLLDWRRRSPECANGGPSCAVRL